jgi:drug/metabolite transporter (DMT)-like permease
MLRLHTDMSNTTSHAREIRPVAASLFMLGACGMFAFNSIFVKLAAETGLHPFQIAFFRNFIALAVILPIVLIRNGPHVLVPNRPGMLTLRGALNGCSMMAWFSAVPLMAITDLTAIGFTGPIWATLLAALILGEKMRLRRWTAIIIGILGALIVVRPGFQEMNNAVYLVLFASASWGATLIVIKRLTSVEHVSTILVYQALAMSVIAFVPMLFVWQNPTAEGWMWMGLLGLLAMGAHSLHVRAFSMQEVSALQPLDFARFPISAVGAYFFLDEILNEWTAVGAFVVFAAGAYISHREALVNRAAKAAGLLQAVTSAPLAPIIAFNRAGHDFGNSLPHSDGQWGPGPRHLYATAWATRKPGLRPKRRQTRE